MAEAQTAQAPQTGPPQRGGNQGGPRRRGPRQDFPAEEKQFDERTLHIDRVARVVKGGRRFRFRALVVLGDKKGKVGIGLAKGADVTAAVTKATDVAKKSMVTIPLYKGTLPHEVEAKVGGARILLKPASQGTGLIAGGVVRTVLEVTGVHNALSKSLGSTNKANTAYATIEALKQLTPAKNWITRQNAPAKPAKTAEAKPAAAAAKAPAKKPAAKKAAAKKEAK
jgi:small subunit ribosomal protein S5